MNTGQVKQYVITGCIPPRVIRCDLWSLQMEAVRDVGYCKATLGHNLLIKIFPKLDHVTHGVSQEPLHLICSETRTSMPWQVFPTKVHLVVPCTNKQALQGLKSK